MNDLKERCMSLFGGILGTSVLTFLSELKRNKQVSSTCSEINLYRGFNKQLTPGVYVIICKPTLQYYVGESEHVDYRIGSHVSFLEKGRNECKLLQQAWSQYGSNEFIIFTVLEGGKCSSVDFRRDVELSIVDFAPEYCFNAIAANRIKKREQERRIDSFVAEKIEKVQVNPLFTGDTPVDPPTAPEDSLGNNIAVENSFDNQDVVNGKIKNNVPEVPPTLRKESRTKRLKLYNEISQSGQNCGFIFVGILFFDTQANSKVEFFCMEHRYFIRRNWETWKRCFNTNNVNYRPSCCHAAQTNKALIPEKGVDLSFESAFETVPEAVLFSPLEQAETLTQLVSSKKTYKPDNGLQKAPKKEELANHIQEQATRLGATVVRVEGDKSKSKVFLFCNSCQKENKGTMIKNLASIQSLRCCIDKNKQKGIPPEIAGKMALMGHQVVGEPPKVKTDRFSIYCTHHHVETTTTIDQYRQVQSGMACCASQKRLDNSNS
jgi:hypothetical protein